MRNSNGKNRMELLGQSNHLVPKSIQKEEKQKRRWIILCRLQSRMLGVRVPLFGLKKVRRRDCIEVMLLAFKGIVGHRLQLRSSLPVVDHNAFSWLDEVMFMCTGYTTKRIRKCFQTFRFNFI